MFPIEQHPSGWWFVWSMRVQHTTDGEHRSKGLEKYRTYQHGQMMCAYYNYHRLLERVK
jgi:hypothetical protein